MDRREFLFTTGGAAVAAASPAAAEPPEAGAEPTATRSAAMVLRLSLPWGDTVQGPGDSALRLARRFEAMTSGRYRVEITGEDGSDGDADLLHGPIHDFTPLHPGYAYFAGLPGSAGLSAPDLARWIAVGGGQSLWDDLAGELGWKPLLAGHGGEAPPLWSREPITGLGSLSGRKVSAPGFGAEVARALGAETQPSSFLQDGMAFRGAAAALADGTVDAVEAGDLATSLALGLPAVARHATGNGFNAHGTAFALHVRRSVWESLPDADQVILAAAASEEFQLSLAEARAHARVARQVLEERFGIRFAPWPADMAGAIERVAEATIAYAAGHDARARRIDQSYTAFRSMFTEPKAGRQRPPVA